MKPFRLSNLILQLKDPYPDKEILLSALKNCTCVEKLGIIRLWLTEGIPFAFRDNPNLYEAIRNEIIEILKNKAEILIHPKEITIIGSGRIGYSLSPNEFGKPFNENSDLDFSIISEQLFLKCKEAFELWLNDYKNNDPALEGEGNKYWPSNAENVPKNINIGFIDSNKIPRLNKYKIARVLGNTEEIISAKLNETYKPPITKRISISVYKNWTAFFQRRYTNIAALIDKP